jgi:hypothetical protein
VAGLVGLAAVGAFAQGGRPIEFSEPRSERARTNLIRLEQGRSGLDRLESELNRPFEFISRGNSMEGRPLPMPLPAPPPVVNSARVKELIERREDLPFMTTEEAFRLNPDADRFKTPELTPDGRDRNRLRPLERALLEADVLDPIRLGADQRELDRRDPRRRDPGDRLGETNRTDSALRPWEQWFGGTAGPAMPGAPGEFEPARPRGESGGFGFAFGQPTPTINRPSETELQRIEAFRQLYDFSNTRPVLTPQELTRGSASYLDRSFYEPPVGSVAPPVTTPSISAIPAPFSAPAYTPPPAPPPPAASAAANPPPSPFLAVPQRPF